MSATWNGLPMSGRSEAESSRVNDMVERGMKRLGYDTSIPSQFNRILSAPVEIQAETGVVQKKRNRAIEAFLKEWMLTPASARSVRKIADAHHLGAKVARQALVDRGLMAPAPEPAPRHKRKARV